MNKIIRKSISEITVSEGRRNIDYVKVSELAESIKIVGLLHPIAIDKDGKLVSGGHRLEACKHLGWKEIDCIELDCDELRIELAEIDENFVRNELDPISMGEHANRRDEILEALGVRANQSNKGKPTGADSAPVKKTADIAKEAGVSERVLQENKQIARNLTATAKEAVKKIDAPKGDMLKLSRKSHEEQEAIAQKILVGGAATIPEAMSAVLAELSDEELDRWIEWAKTKGRSDVDAACERNRRKGKEFDDDLKAGKQKDGFGKKQIRKITKASEEYDTAIEKLQTLFLETLGWEKSLDDKMTLTQLLDSRIERSKSSIEQFEALRAEFTPKEKASTSEDTPSTPPDNDSHETTEEHGNSDSGSVAGISCSHIARASDGSYVAKGELNKDRTFTLFAGSTINRMGADLMSDHVKTEREMFESSGWIKDFTLMRNCFFDSPSKAASFIYGSRINGKPFWKEPDAVSESTIPEPVAPDSTKPATDDSLEDSCPSNQDVDTAAQENVAPHSTTRNFGVLDLFKDYDMSEQNVIDATIHVLAYEHLWHKPEIMEALEDLTSKYFVKPAIPISTSVSRIFATNGNGRDSSKVKGIGLVRNWLREEGILSDPDDATDD